MGELAYQVTKGRDFNEILRPVARDLASAIDPIDYAISKCQRSPTEANLQAIRDRIHWAHLALRHAERTLTIATEES